MSATAPYSPVACPRCGRPMPADAPAGLCPRCLLSDGFGDRSEADFRARTGGQKFVPPAIEELASEFPNLQFVQLLGSGGMGAVYLARQIRLDRDVAVKILPPDLADDAAFAERFLREARALARLSHPNIVGVFDFGQTPGGLYYFLMEYIEGPTLRQVVVNRTADSKQALEIVRQVCDALQFAHDKGVVHRDIKPENILLDSRGRVKIADFGLAKLLGLAEPHGSPAAGSLTHTKQAMGTPHYMAPEQIAGSRAVDHRADIYSLGVVFYELLTGELPLGRFAPPSKKVHVDVRLDEVVLRSLEAEPAQRYQRAGDVKTDVESISFVASRAAEPSRPAATALRYVRQATAGMGQAARTVLQPASEGVLSQKALIALAWAATVPLAILCIVLYETFERGLDLLATLFGTIGFVLALPALTAPVGTTLLGVLAVREVRAGGGRLTGLVPGVAAAVLFPLLLVALLAVYLVGVVGYLITGGDDEPALVAAFLLGTPLAAWGGLWLVRAAWRRATQGLPLEQIEKELSIIPLPLRRASRVFSDWCERIGFPPATLFGGAAFEMPAPQFHDNVPTPQALTSPGSRTSMKATVGAVWAAMFPLGILLFLFVENTNQSDPVYGIAVPLLGLVALPALLSPFATTALGWSAIADIRRTAGRITGLPLALFDGLFFPLLCLDAVIGLVIATATALFAYLALGFGRNGPPAMFVVVLFGVLIGVGLLALVDTLIVRSVWRRVKATGTPEAIPPEEHGPATETPFAAPRRRRDLILAVAAIGIAVGLAAAHAWRENQLRHAPPATVATPVAPMAPPAPDVGSPVPYNPYGEMSGMYDSAAMPPGMYAAGSGDMMGMGMSEANQFWHRGPDGLELNEFWVQSALGADVDTKLRLDAALQRAAADYERVLDAHTDLTFEGDAIRFTIHPFGSELDRLANQFWSRVDPLLTREQQAIMRYNFPLRYQTTQGGFGVQKLYDDKVMPFGDAGHTFGIRIERSGLWYRWQLSSNHAAEIGSTTPELPHWLRRWQERYDVLTSIRKAGLSVDPQRPPLVAAKP